MRLILFINIIKQTFKAFCKNLIEFIKKIIVLDLSELFLAVLFNNLKDIILTLGLDLILWIFKERIQRIVGFVFVFKSIYNFKRMFFAVIIQKNNQISLKLFTHLIHSLTYLQLYFKLYFSISQGGI